MSLQVSVIVPAHNGQEHLARSLAGLNPTAGLVCELIVVDDGSTDDSARIAATHGARVIRTGARLGPASM